MRYNIMREIEEGRGRQGDLLILAKSTLGVIFILYIHIWTVIITTTNVRRDNIMNS